MLKVFIFIFIKDILTLYRVECLSPLHLILFLRFCLVLLFGTYSSVSSFCLILCFYFHAFGRLVTFPNLREVILCRRCPLRPSSILPSDHQSYKLYGFPICGLHESFLVVGPTIVGTLVGRADPQPCWKPGPASCSGSWPTVGRGWVPAWLAARPVGCLDWDPMWLAAWPEVSWDW